MPFRGWRPYNSHASAQGSKVTPKLVAHRKAHSLISNAKVRCPHSLQATRWSHITRLSLGGGGQQVLCTQNVELAREYETGFLPTE